MSTSVYPSLPGLEFPVGRIVVPPPVMVRTTPSQREYRARDATIPRYIYRLSYEWLYSTAAKPHLQSLVGFYNQHGGPFDSWLFSDPDDKTVSAEFFGGGTGSLTNFQLGRVYGGFFEPVWEPHLGSMGIEMSGGLGGNGSFERDTNSDGLGDGWSLFIGGAGDAGRTHAFTRPGTAVVHGSVSQKLEITGGVSNANDSGIIHAVFPVQPNTTYTFGASLYTNIANKAYILARQYQADQVTSAGSDAQTTAVSAALTLTRKTVTFTTGPQAAWLSLQVRGLKLAGEYFQVDGVTLWPGSADLLPSTSRIGLLPADYSVNAGGLLITTVAPAVGASLLWTGDFYRRCRFLGERLEPEKFLQDIWRAKRVEFISSRS